MADEHLQMHSSKFPMDHIGSRDRLVAISASGDGLDNPSLEDPYSIYRGSIRGPTVQGSPGGVYGRSGPSVAVGTDTLRDTCSRMFQRDAWGRSSQNILPQPGPLSQSMSSPGFSEPADSGPPLSTVSAADFEAGKNKNGTLTKKYYHIKDMLSNRFGKNGNESKTGRGSQNNAASSPPNDRLTAVNSSFRKAIQRSSHKSNLNESSSQVYNMQEVSTAASPYMSNYGNGGSYMRMNAPPLPPPPPHPSPMDGGPVYGSCTGRPPSYPPPPPVSGIYGTVTHPQSNYSAVQQRSEAWPQAPTAGSRGHMEPVYGVSSHSAAGPATPQRTGPIPQGPHHTPPCSPSGPEGSGRADRSYMMSNGNGVAATSQSYDPVYMSRQEIRGGAPPTSVSNGGSSQPPTADAEPHPVAAANNSTSEPASDFMAAHRQSHQHQNHQSRLEPGTPAGKPKFGMAGGHSSGNDSEWVDLVENELREILAPGCAEGAGTSATPPLPAFSFDDSPDQSPPTSPKLSLKYPLSYSASALNQPDLIETMAAPYASGRPGADVPRSGPTIPSSLGRGWNPSATRTPLNGVQANRDQMTGRRQCIRPSNRKLASVSSTGAVDGMAGDGTSVNTALDMESILDQTTDITSDEGSTVMEGSPDGLAVRKQLEGLETMYSEVLRLLGGQRRTNQQCRPPRVSALPRHRVYGSMSSLPSSVGGRPTKDRRRDDRKKVKEIKTVSKRFQRLESHVVTLARSVAHLSSEMRSQHMMLQEMENIRAQLNQLRTAPARMSAPHQRPTNEWEAFRDAIPSLTHPGRVRKLTKFFGDEPPLLRIFLKKLGYEKFALLFEREKIGMIELPYMTEERLQKLGIPVGPRLRILQEAQMSLRNDNFNVYIL